MNVHVKCVDPAEQRYWTAAWKATEEGFRGGSHEWWEAIRYHMQYPDAYARENGLCGRCPLGPRSND